jgi:hypothetical protein
MLLIGLPLPYEAVPLSRGALALLAYPRLYGGLLLWGLLLWLARSTAMPPSGSLVSDDSASKSVAKASPNAGSSKLPADFRQARWKRAAVCLTSAGGFNLRRRLQGQRVRLVDFANCIIARDCKAGDAI